MVVGFVVIALLFFLLLLLRLINMLRVFMWRWRVDVNYRSGAAPLPVAEVLSGSAFPTIRQSNALGSDMSRCTDDDPSCIRRAVTKRQVDPLHSCIEAKCSSWNSGNYLDCVYRHCVTGFQVHGKRSSTDAAAESADPNAAAAADDSFGHPEGRFLLLPVAFQSPGVGPQLFPPSSAPHDSEDNEVDEVQQVRAARARLARRRLREGRQHHGRGDRMKRNTDAWNERVGQSGGDRLRASLLARRSYNDIADVCVEHHCGQLPPHTISYFHCVDRHCTGK